MYYDALAVANGYREVGVGGGLRCNPADWFPALVAWLVNALQARGIPCWWSNTRNGESDMASLATSGVHFSYF